MPGHRILTQRIDATTLKSSDLSSVPCFFQQYLEKKFELRVHVIGENVYTCKIDSQLSEKTKLDWRNYDLAHTPHYTYSLDSELSNKCVRLVKEMGLTFGVIDLVITPENETFFLECNSQAHWLWIETLCGLPITDELCNMLAKAQ